MHNPSPIIPWIGGKRRLADRILPLFPPHECYVEAFAGGAALFFLRQQPAKCEVLNDANGDLVALYRVVQNHLQEFVRQFEEDDPIKVEWWRGYMRGLRRAHHGERFGSEAEHQTFIAAATSDDPRRAALGKGYAVGLTLEPRDPPDTDAERAARYKASGRQIAVVLRDPAAILALDNLSEKHGGITAAVTAALLAFHAGR